LEVFRSHDAADKELTALLTQVTIHSNDKSYKRTVLPYSKIAPAAYLKAVGDVVDKFLDGHLDKASFKDKWRDLDPETDEHYSTQSVYITLESLKALPKNRVDRTVLKHTMALISSFRLPTTDTGYSTKVGQTIIQFGHPRGNKPLIHDVPDNKSTAHGTFDILRRTLGIDAASDAFKNDKSDGTGVLLAHLEEVAKFSSRMIGSIDAPDSRLNNTLGSSYRKNAFQRREEHKLKVRSLNSKKSSKLKSQKLKSKQFSGKAPVSSALLADSSGRKWARSPSPMRE